MLLHINVVAVNTENTQTVTSEIISNDSLEICTADTFRNLKNSSNVAKKNAEVMFQLAMNFALAPKTRYRVVLVQPLLYLYYSNCYN